MSSVELILSFPPSVNRYWRNVRGRTLISERGRAYRAQVAKEIMVQRGRRAFSGRLSVTIRAYAPDKRRRDLDNLLKATLDSLQHAGVYLDDSQIDDLAISRGERDSPGGRLVIVVSELE